jgi:hypothetical protein
MEGNLNGTRGKVIMRKVMLGSVGIRKARRMRQAKEREDKKRQEKAREGNSKDNENNNKSTMNFNNMATPELTGRCRVGAESGDRMALEGPPWSCPRTPYSHVGHGHDHNHDHDHFLHGNVQLHHANLPPRIASSLSQCCNPTRCDLNGNYNMYGDIRNGSTSLIVSAGMA